MIIETACLYIFHLCTQHEKISCKALDTLINEESDEEGFEKESVKEAFERFGLNIANDIPFVKDIFQGKARGVCVCTEV